MSSTEETTILDLPEPLTELLAQEVSGHSASLTHALVCRSWVQAALDNIRGVNIRDASDVEQVFKMEEISPRLKTLYLTGRFDTLPEAFTRLTSLENCKLSSRSLHGIPDNIDALTTLKTLHLTGRFENLPEAFTRLTSLEDCKLSSLSLEEIPDGIDALTTLKTLHLTGCFEALPEALTRLTSLEACKLSSLSLEAIPDGIDALTALTSLEIDCGSGGDYGSLESIPESVGNLAELRRLILKVWGLTAIPDSLRRLLKLKVLVLEARLEEFPEFISELTSLAHLDLRCHQCLQVPASYRALTSLTTLKLRGAAFQELPDFFDAFPKLKVLVLGSELLCKLPSSLSECRNLQVLLAADGMLGSRVTPVHRNTSAVHDTTSDVQDIISARADELSRALDIPSLRVLRLSFGGYHDSVNRLPESVSSLVNLHELEMASMPLAYSNINTINDSLGRLRCLQVLAIAGQNIESIPSSISSLPVLKELVISDCPSLREIPDSIGALPSLEDLCISSCRKLQSLPASIGGLSSLLSLDLMFLPDHILLPEDLGALAALRRLTLVQLRDLRALPASFTSLAALEVLAIRGCWKLRSLPQDFGRLQSLQFLLLDNLDSLRELPDSIGDLGSLRDLYLLECRNLRTLPDTLIGLRSLRKLQGIRCGMGAVQPPVVQRLVASVNAEGEEKGPASSDLPGTASGRRAAESDGAPPLSVWFEADSSWAFDPPTVTIPSVRTQKAWTWRHRRVFDYEDENPQGHRSERNKKDEDQIEELANQLAHQAYMDFRDSERAFEDDRSWGGDSEDGDDLGQAELL